MNPIKSGVKTSEFWVTAAIQLVGALVALGLLTSGQADAANKIIGIVASLIGMLLSGVVYTQGRTTLKQTVADNSPYSPTKPLLAIAFACLLLAGSTANAETQYERMYAAAVEADKPLLVCVGISEDTTPVPMGSDLFVCVDKLEGYSAGDVVWCAPSGGRLLHVKTMSKPTVSQVVASRPKRLAFGCETGKCSYTYFPAVGGSCQGGSCSGPASCGAGGVCSSCTKCTATGAPATIRSFRTVQSAGNCLTCPK
jgi:hypothetical protein